MKRSAVEENKIGSEIGLLEVLEYENSQVHQSQILIYFVYHAFKGELLKNFAHECEYFDMRLRKSALITVLRIRDSVAGRIMASQRCSCLNPLNL